jgi:hypothetical protein
MQARMGLASNIESVADDTGKRVREGLPQVSSVWLNSNWLTAPRSSRSRSKTASIGPQPRASAIC